ncbi:MAG: hypothetical protein K9H26_04640 [Prolixibacteraceae bacterium]|nr:hypothetical protein [Prolixibacteraceae bacterium]
MKIKSYLLVKAGEVFLVIITLVLILAFKLQAQETPPSEVTRYEMAQQIIETNSSVASSQGSSTLIVSINNNNL